MEGKEYLVMDDTGNEAIIECTPEMDTAINECVEKIEVDFERE